MERRGTRWQHKKAGGRFKGVSSKEEREREREDTRSDTKQREGEGPIRRMKRRLARWKECRRTSAGGQPCARGFSLASRRLSRPGRLLPSRYTRENTLSLSPPVSNLPLPSSAAAAFFSSRHTVVVVVVDRSPSLAPLQTDGHMRARLWWLLIPPGASLVTHAAPRAAHSILLILAPLAQVYPYVRPTLPLPAT